MYGSKDFSGFLQDLVGRGLNQIVFIIGGPLGLSRNVIDRAHKILSLSPMTFTHEMVRIILLEQIYRALTIAKGEKYHK